MWPDRTTARHRAGSRCRRTWGRGDGRSTFPEQLASEHRTAGACPGATPSVHRVGASKSLIGTALHDHASDNRRYRTLPWSGIPALIGHGRECRIGHSVLVAAGHGPVAFARVGMVAAARHIALVPSGRNLPAITPAAVALHQAGVRIEWKGYHHRRGQRPNRPEGTDDARRAKRRTRQEGQPGQGRSRRGDRSRRRRDTAARSQAADGRARRRERVCVGGGRLTSRAFSGPRGGAASNIFSAIARETVEARRSGRVTRMGSSDSGSNS